MQILSIKVLYISWHRSNGVASVQCRTVKISILGDEGVPVQVDGEAWIQPPGYIRIVHKNRAQTLTRDRVRALPTRPGGVWATYSWAHLYGHQTGVFVLGFLFTTQRLADIVVCPVVSII